MPGQAKAHPTKEKGLPPEWQALDYNNLRCGYHLILTDNWSARPVVFQPFTPVPLLTVPVM